MSIKKVQDDKKKDLALFYNKRIRSMEEVFNVRNLESIMIIQEIKNEKIEEEEQQPTPVISGINAQYYQTKVIDMNDAIFGINPLNAVKKVN